MNILRNLLFVSLMFLLFSCKKSTQVAEEKVETENKTSKEVSQKVILFYGNSITAGYGLDPSQAFPSVIQKKLDSLDVDYKVVNAGVSGETSAAGINRLDWVLKQKVDVFVLELGANDGLRGIKLQETKKNLQTIIDKVKGKYSEAKIILAGMEMPPNMGPEYTQEFRTLFKDLAKENKLPLIPFLLEGVGGEPKLNLPDGIHPTADGHKIVANNVWNILKDVL